MIILERLYTDIRKYLIAALDLQQDAPIVQGYQNANPIPIDAIIMTFRDDGRLDQTSHTYENGKIIVFDSIRGVMQLDFYGESSYDKARQIATLWKSPYTTTTLQDCVPLNCFRIRDLSFVNEAGFYELRYMIELELQYNTKYEKTVNIAKDVSQIGLESINAI